MGALKGCCLVSWGINRLVAGLDFFRILGHTLVLNISSVTFSIGNIGDNLKTKTLFFNIKKFNCIKI